MLKIKVSYTDREALERFLKANAPWIVSRGKVCKSPNSPYNRVYVVLDMQGKRAK